MGLLLGLQHFAYLFKLKTMDLSSCMYYTILEVAVCFPVSCFEVMFMLGFVPCKTVPLLK